MVKIEGAVFLSKVKQQSITLLNYKNLTNQENLYSACMLFILVNPKAESYLLRMNALNDGLVV